MDSEEERSERDRENNIQRGRIAIQNNVLFAQENYFFFLHRQGLKGGK